MQKPRHILDSPHRSPTGCGARYARQSLTLTGLGEGGFEEVINAVAEVHDLFKRAVGERLQDCSILTTHNGHPAIEMSNRFFTPRGEANPEDVCQFEDGVDPLGYLVKAAGTQWVHTSDNRVLYYERKPSATADEYE